MSQPSRFKQAREIRGLTQMELARDIGVDQPTISLIERGLAEPKDDVIRALALRLKFPPSFFKKPMRFQFPEGSLAYRKQARVSRTQEAQFRQYAHLVFDLAEYLIAKVNAPSLRLPRLQEDPVIAARITRSQLGFAPDQPIDHLLLAVERAGVLAIALPLCIEGLDGFSAWAGNDVLVPVLVLGGNPSWERRRFTIAHELAHLVLHQSPQGSVQQLEEEANIFASEILLPEVAMCHQLRGNLAMRDLIHLKQIWKVSVQALIRRALDLDLCTERQYRYVHEQLSALRMRKNEPGSLLLPLERPRALRKMAEVLYGDPINYDKLAEGTCLPVALMRELFDHCMSRDDLERPRRDPIQPEGKLVTLPDRKSKSRVTLNTS